MMDINAGTQTPTRFHNVSQTQLSVARYYGGCTVNGKNYFYNPMTDELIRDDVLKAEAKAAKLAAKEAKKVTPKPVEKELPF